MIKRASLLVSTVFLCINMYAWKEPMKYGDVTIEELQMTTCDIDSSAEAVVLCHYGYFNAELITFREHIRIKVLKKEGLNWANYVFYTSTKGNIKGKTYNLENGEIVESKLTNESVFENRIYENYYNFRVAMPNVKEGSVIDIECEYNGVPYFWDFQMSIPVKWSELIIEPHTYLGIKQNYYGSLQYEYQDNMRWVIKDAPAIHEEPFINSIKNYKQRVEMVFYSKMLGLDWHPLITYLLEDAKYFGYPIKSVTFLNQYVNEIKEKSNTEEELIRNAFEFVRKHMEWDENERMFTSEESLQYIFNKGIGNSADINLMLLVILKKLGLEAYPLILSTRENGVLLPTFPNLFKPNYVIVHIIGGNSKNYFLDVTDKYNSINILPERCLNGSGKIIDYQKFFWVEVLNGKKDILKSVYTLGIDENAQIVGSIKNIRREYNAYNFRKEYFSYNSKEEYLKAFAEDRPGIEIMDSKITNSDSVDLDIIDEYDFITTNYITQIDSELYITPLLYESIEHNPFNNEKRDLPIDFIYPREKTIQVTIIVPDSYLVVKVPAQAVIKLPDNSAKCLYSSVVNGNTINIVFQFSLNKHIFLQNEYPFIQEFYSQVIKKSSEPILLKLK